jgi:hypothetical protein
VYVGSGAASDKGKLESHVFTNLVQNGALEKILKALYNPTELESVAFVELEKNNFLKP